VINKADRDGADQTARDLRAETDAPILKFVATQGHGLPDLVEAIDNHHREDPRRRRMAQARAHILSLAQARLQTHPDLGELAAQVASGRCDADTAAERLLRRLAESRGEPIGRH
jgi:LAO/AO transport system kinase